MKRLLPLLLLLVSSTNLFGQNPIPEPMELSFRIPLVVQVGSINDTLYFGVNPGSTVGIDDDLSLGEFLETQAPPLPPSPFPYDTRFITLPGRVNQYPTGLGTGTFTDFRPYIGPAQVDSFLLYFQGEAVKTTDIRLSWPANLGDFSDNWIIKPFVGEDFPATDMNRSTSVTVPSAMPFKQVFIIKTGLLVDVERLDAPQPRRLALLQNYPNPFNPSTRITWDVKEAGAVQLTVHDLLGNHVRTLVHRHMEAGRYTLDFNASRLASGMYLYRLTDGRNTITKRMMLVR